MTRLLWLAGQPSTCCLISLSPIFVTKFGVRCFLLRPCPCLSVLLLSLSLRVPCACSLAVLRCCQRINSAVSLPDWLLETWTATGALQLKMVLLENDAFLTELSRMFVRAKGSGPGTVNVTSKKCKSQAGLGDLSRSLISTMSVVTRPEAGKKGAAAKGEGESMCLMRATLGSKKISTKVRSVSSGFARCLLPCPPNYLRLLMSPSTRGIDWSKGCDPFPNGRNYVMAMARGVTFYTDPVPAWSTLGVRQRAQSQCG